MRYTANIDDLGVVTIPKEVLDALKIRPGKDRAVIEASDDVVTMMRQR